MHNLPSESFKQPLVGTFMLSYFSDENRFSTAFLTKLAREILPDSPFWCYNFISVEMAIVKAQFFKGVLSLTGVLLETFSFSIYKQLEYPKQTTEPVIHSAVQVNFCETWMGIFWFVVGLFFFFPIQLKEEPFWKSINEIESAILIVTSMNL